MGIEVLMERLASPARRALAALKLKSIEALAKYRKEEIAALHGIGPSALRVIEAEMTKAGTKFKVAAPARPPAAAPAQQSVAAPARPPAAAPASTVEFSTIDEYIRGFSGETRARLERMRAVIRENAPGARERIAYQMPTFAQEGNLVHFAAFKNHIGFYPTPSGIESFERDLAPYKSAKGSVQFPFDEPMPWDLIARMVRHRVRENVAKAKRKARKL